MATPDAQQQGAAAPAATAEVSEFESLLQKEFKVQKDSAKLSAVKTAVQTLAGQALEATALISDDAIKSIEAIIAEIDKRLSEQISKIMHHEDFKSLEGTWRGLAHLVNNTETDESLKIRVLNVSKKEVAATIKKFKGTAWDQSPLFK
jgi:type VI secretion system protein ImpC